MDNNDYINALLHERMSAQSSNDTQRVSQIEGELKEAGYSGDYTPNQTDPGWQRTPPVNTAAGVVVDDAGNARDLNNPNAEITANFQDRPASETQPSTSNEQAAAADQANEERSDDAPQERAVRQPRRGVNRGNASEV